MNVLGWICLVSIILNVILITVIVLLIKFRLKKNQDRYVKRDIDLILFKKKLEKIGPQYDKKIKAAKTIDDFISLTNDILSKYQNNSN